MPSCDCSEIYQSSLLVWSQKFIASDKLCIFDETTSFENSQPQLINVFFGQMSLIGPRPLLVEYNDYYNDEENKRFLVKPGISGLAQVSGRNGLSWNEKLKLDPGPAMMNLSGFVHSLPTIRVTVAKKKKKFARTFTKNLKKKHKILQKAPYFQILHRIPYLTNTAPY